jgi:ATP/maltotriose-dependent transcriptional regulator MalT
MLRGVSQGWPSFGSGRFRRRTVGPPIARPGLMARLDAADGLVVLVGGAGAGKSTLLDAWVAARGGVFVDLAQPDQRHGLADAPADGVLAIDGVAAGDVAQIRGLAERRGVVVAAEAEISGVERISAVELGFAEDETYQVLGAAFGDAAAADVLAPDLHLLTNGWPALVGLAAAWLAQHPEGERRERLLNLARVEIGLSEFLVPAVISGLGDADRELVRRLARLPGLDARTADRLDITEDLGAVAPFVQGLARRPGWFVVPEGWKAAIRAELPLSAAEVERLHADYSAAL